MVLGDGVQMLQAVDLVDPSLVGQFQGRRMEEKNLRDWLKFAWELSIGYYSLLHVLTKGRMAFTFRFA